MELLLVLVFVLSVAAYYGFMRSVETAANIANAEVEHMSDVHYASLISRTAKLGAKLDDETIKSAEEVKAKIRAMRGA